MGAIQAEFLREFKERFRERFGGEMDWGGGQFTKNKAAFPQLKQYRRDGRLRKNEGIELGDMTSAFRGVTIIVEYDSTGLDIQNLLKYWPYLLGRSDVKPPRKIVLCHFSSWVSWGSRRDEWAWVLGRMAADPERVMDIEAELFDNGWMKRGVIDRTILSRYFEMALDFIDAKTLPIDTSRC